MSSLQDDLINFINNLEMRNRMRFSPSAKVCEQLIMLLEDKEDEWETLNFAIRKATSKFCYKISNWSKIDIGIRSRAHHFVIQTPDAN